MVKIPKAVLWWSSEDDGYGMVTDVGSGKKVWLNGSNNLQHTPFRILRRNSFSRIPRIGRKLFGAWITDVPTVYLDGGNLRSATYWHATNISLTPSATEYYFIDANGGVSGSLAVTNTPYVHWTKVSYGGAVFEPKLDVSLSATGLSTAHARAELLDLKKGYELTLEGDIVAPQDPVVEIELLEPGKSRDMLVSTVQESIEFEIGMRANDRNPLHLSSVLPYIDSFLEPRNVDFEFQGEEVFMATPDEPRTISVTVRGDEPVKLLFAIKVNNIDTRTHSVSEFMPVIVLPPKRR